MGNRDSRDLATRLYSQLAPISLHCLKRIAYHLCLAVQLHGNWRVLSIFILTVVKLWRTGCTSADDDSAGFYMITRGSFKILGSPGDWRHPSQHQRQPHFTRVDTKGRIDGEELGDEEITSGQMEWATCVSPNAAGVSSTTTASCDGEIGG